MNWTPRLSRVGPLAALALLAVLGCAPRPTSGAPTVTATSLYTTETPPRRVGELDLVGAYELRSSGDRRFGGFSAARRVGDTLYLLSDRSFLYALDWPADAGRASRFSLSVRAKQRLATAHGAPLDAEALVVAPEGTVLAGDETTGRVFRFAAGSGAPEGKPLRLPPVFAEAGARNRGLETLAAVPGRGLLAIMEDPVAADGAHPAVLIGPEGQQSLSYQAGDAFLVTDADVAGDWLIVLERRLSLFTGWQSRIVAVPLKDLDGGDAEPISGHELARIAGSVLGENYEGLTARLEPDGSVSLLIVSDDNFSPLQRTQLLELRWQP